MKPAPLLLERYFLTNLNIIVIPGFDPKQGHRYKFDNFQNTVNITTNKDFPGLWQVELSLKYLHGTKENIPYDFSLKLVGFFAVHPKWPKNQVETLVKINGPAILYSAAREIIAQVTGRGPWGPMLLPAVNFIDR